MKNKINIHYVPCLRNSVACDHDFWYTCDGSCRGFYHFFKILSFLSCYLGWKGKKWPKMMKNVIWRTDLRNRTSSLSFMVHLCEMRKYPGLFFFFFFFFLKFWFSGFSGVKGKKWTKLTKNYVCHALYLRDHTSYDLHSWYTCVKW